ncbi:MAG TPA: tripartite tricarboxylate transporter TctB family protein [Stellaceae bacterium]|nr:tripartite tricarboxylate transporter TctB family protein [Stellaceae bacterium]
MSGRIGAAIPYAVLLGVAAFLFHVAGEFDFTRTEGRLGPDFWPRAILALLIATCAYELVGRLLRAPGRQAKASAIGEATTVEDIEPEAAPPARHPYLLWSGAGLTLLYVALLQVLGFFTATFLYTLVFMRLGRYRRWPVLIAASLCGALVFMFVFMKIVYVSLPIGREPFSAVSLLLMRLMGIH